MTLIHDDGTPVNPQDGPSRGTFPSIGCHCFRCGTEYNTPYRPNCECAGDPPVDHDDPDYEAYPTRVQRLRYDREED